MKSILQIEDLSKEELFGFIRSTVKEEYESIKKQDETGGTITTQEAAKILNVADITIHNYIKKGILPAKKVGRKYIINEKDVRKALSDAKSLKYQRA